jgi:hypothetical protein
MAQWPQVMPKLIQFAPRPMTIPTKASPAQSKSMAAIAAYKPGRKQPRWEQLTCAVRQPPKLKQKMTSDQPTYFKKAVFQAQSFAISVLSIQYQLKDRSIPAPFAVVGAIANNILVKLKQMAKVK